LIAATAVLNQARLATANQSDFKVFTAHGLTLA
jgi:predicted nucleic acid-binding protein